MFIDEIHRLNRVVEEYLYPAMEDFRLDIMLDSGPAARSVNLPLKHFTLVGATTRSGLLTGPLRDRFGLQYRLELYNEKDIVKILMRSARILGVELTEGAAEILGGRCRGTPRIANRVLNHTGNIVIIIVLYFTRKKKTLQNMFLFCEILYNKTYNKKNL